MVSKSKKRSKGRGVVDPVECVKRSLSRGDYKQALKDARVACRQSPTAEIRCLLEHAYAGRIQQDFVKNGLDDDARRIIRELLDLGITEPSVKAGLPEWLVSVGMLDCLPRDHGGLTEEQRHRLTVKAADRAVVAPNDIPASMGFLRDEAMRIRAALEAVYRDDEPAALAHLKEIPRQSVYADWRLFVRGLMAYYRRDKSEMEANWERLHPDRMAATIAAPLRVMAGTAPCRPADGLQSKLSRLEQGTVNHTILGSLTRLRQAVADHDWPQVLKTFRLAHQTLRESGGDLYPKVVACLCHVLASKGLVDEVAAFSRIAGPPPTDPHWNRAKALACEESEYYDDNPLEYWHNYLADLEELPLFSPAQRDLARGLVWLRLAEYHADGADQIRECVCGADHSSEIARAEAQAENTFERCFTLAPAYCPAYAAAARYHTEAGRPEEAVAVYARLLEHVPDNLDALVYLAEHHLRRGDPRQACRYAGRARQLKPLDRKTADLLWSAHVGAARDLACQDFPDEAREELAAADRILPLRAVDYDMLACKAALEIKAGNLLAARQFVEQALESVEEPAPLWLAMTLESVRQGLPMQETWLYEERWSQALKRRCRGATAGQMCRLLAAQSPLPPSAASVEKYSRELVAYVRRCTRLKWAPGDLRDVCEFLAEREQWEPLMKLAKTGTRKFPDVGYYHFVKGLEEISKGPFRFDSRRAVQAFQRAIELASKSGDPRDEKVLEEAQHHLDLADAVPHLDDFCPGDKSDDEIVSGGPLDGIPIGAVRGIIERLCGRLGLDPEVVLDDIVEGRVR